MLIKEPPCFSGAWLNLTGTGRIDVGQEVVNVFELAAPNLTLIYWRATIQLTAVDEDIVWTSSSASRLQYRAGRVLIEHAGQVTHEMFLNRTFTTTPIIHGAVPQWNLRTPVEYGLTQGLAIQITVGLGGEIVGTSIDYGFEPGVAGRVYICGTIQPIFYSPSQDRVLLI